ncbi:putative cysteine and histidine-rich domain-containing protein RAR1 [Helianthus anomalus]
MANLLRCRRIGCTATFTEDDNPDDSCTYHESLYVLCVWALSTNRTSLILQASCFPDGMNEWSCCKRRSSNLSLFLNIPGCMTGKHTTEPMRPNAPAEGSIICSRERMMGELISGMRGLSCRR